MSFSCIIIDDEPVAHTILETYIHALPDLKLLKNFYNCKEAGNYLQKNTVDILLLDIHMPEQDGISFLKTLTQKPVTIFTTAFLNHAIEAYDLGVIDYLVKPIRPERFIHAIERAQEFLRLQSAAFKFFQRSDDNTIIIKSGTDKIPIDTTAITHIQALKDYMLIFTPKKKYVVRATVNNMLEQLPKGRFIRAHKSFIVNISKIKLVSTAKIELDDHTIPLGKTYKAGVEKALSFI